MSFISHFLLLFVEIPDFMSPEEADHIVKLAEEVGFLKSDIHLDPVAKKHAQTMRSTEGIFLGLFDGKTNHAASFVCDQPREKWGQRLNKERLHGGLFSSNLHAPIARVWEYFLRSKNFKK